MYNVHKLKGDSIPSTAHNFVPERIFSNRFFLQKKPRKLSNLWVFRKFCSSDVCHFGPQVFKVLQFCVGKMKGLQFITYIFNAASNFSNRFSGETWKSFSFEETSLNLSSQVRSNSWGTEASSRNWWHFFWNTLAASPTLSSLMSIFLQGACNKPDYCYDVFRTAFMTDFDALKQIKFYQIC